MRVKFFEPIYLRNKSHKKIMEIVSWARRNGFRIKWGYDKKKGAYIVVG